MVININRHGNTIIEETKAKKIINAVSCPYEANIGIGANHIIVNPTILDAADPSNAVPVPLEAFCIARDRVKLRLNSSRNLSVI